MGGWRAHQLEKVKRFLSGQSPFIPVALRANGPSSEACLMNHEQQQMAFPKHHWGCSGSGTPPLSS